VVCSCFVRQLSRGDRRISLAHEQAFRGVEKRLLGCETGGRYPGAIAVQGLIS